MARCQADGGGGSPEAQVIHPDERAFGFVTRGARVRALATFFQP
jgi:hypothetical protein